MITGEQEYADSLGIRSLVEKLKNDSSTKPKAFIEFALAEAAHRRGLLRNFSQNVTQFVPKSWISEGLVSLGLVPWRPHLPVPSVTVLCSRTLESNRRQVFEWRIPRKCKEKLPESFIKFLSYTYSLRVLSFNSFFGNE